ncbi:MAG: aminotransferase class I/II-fold pyridoxal phosphate-dependent enzyme [Clostridiales bacterium]|uniref:aminotransferase class I/II-fold pyridoxal phosphate-dependent enzyme n=1 Tax=Clostridium sp. N3C TaxID=1776758 RepID=UPI00092DF011|nr:aminotransferase class I/II-fold pyridoxal phosphate-dependent enzyme [Clostridium sp. N3C]NLZ49396.1 aminotransferase class I/II-fold pyridoxal phosphate-dependent enzyme [Clostridiales bacterium]SCN23404.1 putative N-acetyl-LL-diaminopimelate aminotransferase [Clostridium sp. N3C]
MKIEDMIRDNVKNMPPSGIRKYFDLVNEMDDVISLGVGEPDFVTPWKVREVGIYSLEKGQTHYSSNAGFVELRQEIANYLKRYDLHYDPSSEIIVTVGGSEGIDIALRALVGPGDEVIIPEPSFVAYKGCTAFTGATAKVINLREEDQFKLTPELLEAAITPKTKVVIIPFPNNPTGSIMTREELASIVEVLKDKDLIVISDEIYSELSYGEKHVSIASFPEIRDKTIVINGFSKAFAMTGWRLGYVCGHPILIEQMKKIHQYALMCAPTTAQFAAIEALRNCDREVNDMVKEYNRRRRVMVNGFRKMGLSCFEPLGAFYVFPSIKSTGLTSDEFCEGLLKQERVLVVPGTAFGECGEGFVRACYASSYENIVEALKRIERFIKNL